ncbi:MAG: prepilin-type N-terminal cleavage/methylation domain-containing protein [Firmicutes bacterium]|nr:prepilin-type N-terminal cleavage/methylation domain-containing protein [Bacillota bacterium]
MVRKIFYSYFINREEAFTLIEIIMAIAILSIIIIASSQYYINSIHFVNYSEIRSQALLIARIAIEEIKAAAVNNWDTAGDVAAVFSIESPVFSSIDLLSNDYNITINLAEIDIDGDGNNDDLREITVNVSWEQGNLELESLISKR